MRIAKGKRRRRVAVLLAVCVLMPAGMAWAADPAPSPSDSAVAESEAPLATQVAELRSRYQKAQQDAHQAYAASDGKPNEQRIKLNPHPYALKAMELASEHPKDPGAVEALRFVLEITVQGQGSSEDARLRAQAINQLSQGELNDPGLASVFPTFMYEQSQAGERLMRLAAEKSTNSDVRGSAMFWLAQSLRTTSERSGNPEQLAEAKERYQRLRAQAIDQLSQGQLNDPGLASVFPTFMYDPSDAGEKLMRLAAEKSTNRDVRGAAMFWLAQSLRTTSEHSGNPQQVAEAKKLYQQVDAEYADVKTARSTLGDQAKANLFEIANLAVGKAAPDIEGKDQDGKPMKLSDYRGKVVVLDFWGDW